MAMTSGSHRIMKLPRAAEPAFRIDAMIAKSCQREQKEVSVSAAVGQIAVNVLLRERSFA